jgi:hypothetical protein
VVDAASDLRQFPKTGKLDFTAGSSESLDKMFNLAVKTVLTLALCSALPACGLFKEAGRTIGRTTRDVTKEIGHGARDITREIGHGTRDATRAIDEGARDATNATAEAVKKAVKPAPPDY